MAKINILFNGTNYSINEAALESAVASLKTHLSSVINGTGTTIKLGGVTYNIDSTKLTEATTDFVTHLGTISGTGHKVVIGDVEYGVSSDKVADAVTELEIVLSGLNNPEAPDNVAVLDEAVLDYSVLA